jgi:hypothetical protein
VRRTHRSSGDLVPQRQELSWRNKVGVWRKHQVLKIFSWSVRKL